MIAVQSRPFGMALLVAGWQEGSGPVRTDPSGTTFSDGHERQCMG